MTVAELQFLSIVPRELKKLNENIEQLIEAINKLNTQDNGSK